MLCQRPALWPVIFIKNKIVKNLFDEILKLKFWQKILAIPIPMTHDSHDPKCNWAYCDADDNKQNDQYDFFPVYFLKKRFNVYHEIEGCSKDPET